ncbi:protein-export chaperone SecB [Candidatus Puniceispirillum marinum]|uniref:Protein-export protein SecB n=1 Tax=Puniceispirillum marinum (strain IMCC1322) TaxID=488538 RepID=D5BUD1_PUNMI|nr:protein-export chaperone SecB [Candidatus Puniceispirillum marinum]ADE39878.1 protein-export protein SecB [Candidatus Puniceispirillum marinum IMCC1322]
MANNSKTTDSAAADGAGENTQAMRQLIMHAQYIKDLSFENPNAPNVLTENTAQPDVEIGVNVGAKMIGEDQFEVLLNLTAKAKADDTALFLVDLTYAGLVSAPNTPENELNPLIMIEAPRLLFPFARAIVSDMTRDGGFMPLNIQPVDFVAVYQHNLARQQEEAQAGEVH